MYVRERPELNRWLILLNVGSKSCTAPRVAARAKSAGCFIKALLPPGNECWGYDGLATPFPVPGGSDLCHQPITSYPENDFVPSGFLTSPFALPRSLLVISVISLCPPLSSPQVLHWFRILLCWKYEFWAPSVRRGILQLRLWSGEHDLLMPFIVGHHYIASEPSEILHFTRPITQCGHHRLQLSVYLPLRIYPFRPSSQPDPSKTG
ncbi:hypothetical protein ASPTUDRAFT_60574 [Aspergillus tubingensis CBS 134.48]|uniref:Uncharacterized protein n=1 Tax=Aspergillus tubingensis (strain CBS 134.48) TaxID=767770 RepID=A0A1L9NL09_ASPTC|nr:hypothetical protein ASPTUDRAFT_60574 [Aspergillus tubingensis CBS 134.48]